MKGFRNIWNQLNNANLKGGEMMNKIFKVMLLSIMVLFLVASNASATLLGLNLGVPDIFSDTTGTYTYDATTDLFTSTATALTITFDGTTLVGIVGGSYSVSFYVDNTGSFAGGVGGADLTISGSIDVNGDGFDDYTGILVAGEVTNFGYSTLLDPSLPLVFDFTFDFTSGALSSFYALTENRGGNISTVEKITGGFPGWDADSSGSGVKSDTAPVPEPASLLLLGFGLVGMSFFRRRKKA